MGEWARQPECGSGQACDTETGECIGAPEIASFTSDIHSIHSGASVILSWDVTGADAIALDPDLGSPMDVVATVSPTETTTYTLTATNEAGSSTATVTVHLVSAGNVDYIRHYGTTSGEGARGLIVDESNDRLVTVNAYYSKNELTSATDLDGLFMAEHSLATGEVERRTSGIEDRSAYSISATGDQFLVVGTSAENSGSAPVVTLFDRDLEAVDSLRFVIGNPDWENAEDIAVSSKGEIYAAGSSQATGGGYLVRIEADLGAYAFEPVPAPTTKAIAIDSADRIYIAGPRMLNRYSTSDLLNPSKTAVVATTSPVDYITDLAIESDGSIIAVGQKDGVGFIAKFGADLGAHLWRIDLSGSQYFTKVAVDTADNIFVAGTIPTVADETGIVVGAYTPDGNILWKAVQRGSTENDTVEGIATDRGGRIYVVGQSSAAISGSGDYSDCLDGYVMRIE